MNLALAANLFNNTKISNGNYTYVGIGCSCFSSTGALCAFIFTHTYIGFDVEEPKPKFIPYTDAASCPFVPFNDIYETSSCTSTQFQY